MKLVNLLNDAKSIGLCKYAAKFIVYVRLKDGRLFDSRVNGNTVKADSDYCYTIFETDIFSRLWNEHES